MKTLLVLVIGFALAAYTGYSVYTAIDQVVLQTNEQGIDQTSMVTSSEVSSDSDDDAVTDVMQPQATGKTERMLPWKDIVNRSGSHAQATESGTLLR